MEKVEEVKYITLSVLPIYHYNFKNSKGKDIKTTKFIILQYNVMGNSELLNDEELFNEVEKNVSYDGRNWIIVK